MMTMCSVSIDVKDVEDCPQTFPDLEQRLQVYCAYLLTPEVHHITLNTHLVISGRAMTREER